MLTHGVQGGGQASPHPPPWSLGLCAVSGAETHRPVDQVKHQEHDREHNEEHVIHLGPGNRYLDFWSAGVLKMYFLPVIFFSDGPQFALLLRLFPIFLSFQTAFFLLPQEVSVAEQSPEDKEDADQHPGADGSHALHVGRIGCHDVKDVDEHEEEGDEHRHPAGDHLRGDEEADPGDHHEEARWQVVDVEILQHVTR